MAFADRVTHLAQEGAYEMLVRAQALEASGREVIHMEIGQPDFPTFGNVVESGIKAIREGHTRYSPSNGIWDLREAIARAAGEARGVSLKAEQVVVGPGAKPALFFPTLALVERGDEVIIPDPGFPTYRAMVQVAGGIPVPIVQREEKGFSFNIEDFDRLINDRTRMIVINSPNNPTGGVLDQSTLAQIAQVAMDRDLWVLSDEIYSRLTYGNGPAPSILSVPGMAERTILCDGFSKTYAMTGWRLGYGIMPESLAERVGLLLTHSVGCTATFTQIAGLEAISGPQDQAENIVGDHQRRRDQIVNGLNGIEGVQCRKPGGAFYVFPNVSSFGRKSNWMADYLLEEVGVAVLPGTAFGAAGEGHIRLCYALEPGKIARAVELMGSAFRKLG
jgi:aspartate aminotransferase